MKNFIGLLLIALITQTSFAQRIVEKQVPIGQAKNINFNFTRPELITIRTWSGSEVKLVASVEINKGANDDAFNFKIDNSGGEISITSIIEDYENIPRKIRLHHNGQEVIFNTDDTNSPEIQKYKEDNGDSGYDYMNIGVIIDISVEVWVPEQATINVYSKFGLIEVVGVTKDMTIHSKFGGIDLTTNGSEEIEAGTKFGEKYTNLSNKIVPISIGTQPGKWDRVKFVGSKSSIHQELKSEFGNIYIRKL